MQERGVLYITTGKEYVIQAEKSAHTVKQNAPELPITIISNQKEHPDIFDSHKFIKDPYYSSRDKVENILRTEYEQTIYLDADTHVCRNDSLSSIFELLSNFDIAVASDPYNRGNQFYDGSEVPTTTSPDSLTWFNTGVVGFNSNATVTDSFAYWRELYEDYAQEGPVQFDQIPFRQMIYETDIRYGLLPPEFNYVLKSPQIITEEVRILHTVENINNANEIVNQINRDITNKLRTTNLPPRWSYTPVHFGNKTILVQQPHHKYRQYIELLRLSIQECGFRSTLRSIVSYLRGDGFFDD